MAVHGVKEIPDLKVRALVAADLTNVDHGVEGKGGAVLVIGTAADGGSAGSDVVKLPLAESVVNEQVVHEERWVTGRGDGISHDTTNTVVALSVVAMVSS